MSLEHLVPLKNYVPTIYTGVKEIDAIVEREDSLLGVLISIIDKEYARMFIQTSDEIGVLRFEQIMGITANPSLETLEFRKQRLLTRSNATLPYSAIWLRIYLNSVIGEHNYELNIDYDNDIITLYGYLLDYSWAREATNVIAQVKPCNMIFINVPTMIENVGPIYWIDDNTWQGTTWNDDESWKEYKYISSSELQDYEKQVEGTTEFNALLNHISGTRLNKSHVITNMTKTIREDTIYIEFEVPETIKLLESVEILNTQGVPMISANCFIDTPTGTTVVMRLSCYVRKGT